MAGCGNGREAAWIRERLGATVEAFDWKLDRLGSMASSPGLTFRECDIHALPYQDDSFDVVFYHHVIEHVDDPVRSLDELARVLRPGGWMFVGTPNRHRLVGGVGAFERSLRQKVRRNLHDWSMRLQGRFRNECGAHAGFSEAELDGMLAPHFVERRWLTREYLLFKYATGMRRLLVGAVTTAPLRRIAAPSIYAWCRAHPASRGDRRSADAAALDAGR